jgi:hypothetical protein
MCFIASFLTLLRAVDCKKEAYNIYLVYEMNQVISKIVDTSVAHRPAPESVVYAMGDFYA